MLRVCVVGDELEHHDEMMFTTWDMDNDLEPGKNCATLKLGAWWFKACYTSHLNGPYTRRLPETQGIHWTPNSDTSPFGFLIFTEMKIRPTI